MALPVDPVPAWAASGAMALTGRANGPELGPPDRLVPGLVRTGRVLTVESGRLGRPVTLDPLALLGERAALMGSHRQGVTSCGGHTKLLRAANGWLALSLARTDDIDMIPAWLQSPAPPADPWPFVAADVSTRDVHALVEQARLLGMPIAALPATTESAAVDDLPVSVTPFAGPPGPVRMDELTVVDLTALWAGPLCTSILAQTGATVIKVESMSRPDGLRAGEPALFDLLNAGKRSVQVDLRDPSGRAALKRLIATADVVVESSRPRALELLGLFADHIMSTQDGPLVWVSITGYGRRPPGRDWVAFGDDAAVAGGLVVHDDGGPLFCADAIADPASGLVAAAATVRALGRGGRWLIDVAMAKVAAAFAGPTLPVPRGVSAQPPRSRPVLTAARPLGADTADVLTRR